MLKKVSLDDKYQLKQGRIYITGQQALVRLPLMQRWRDMANGLDTGGFISGYRGSPLGGYDMMLWQAKKHLAENHIVFQPGINEDLGATSVWGSQQVALYPEQKYKGVFGLWYGKGPGVDRSGDVLKHANMAGTSRHGGVLAVAGDDHACKSSTLPNQSEFAFMDAGIPMLHPADVEDILDYGLYGWAMSRFSGCWVGLKALADNMDASESVFVGPEKAPIVIPTDFEMPRGGMNIRWPDTPAAQEERLHHYKLPAVRAFARANKLDKIMVESKGAALGIVTTGKAYYDTLQALNLLGISKEDAAKIGIRIYKVILTWPLEPQGILEFAQGLKEIVTVEEKRALLEPQIKEILYHHPAAERSLVIGKHDERGAPLLPVVLDLQPHIVAEVLRARLLNIYPGLELKSLRPALTESHKQPIKVRPPFYCSGCPHNTSTKLPEGSRAMAGIGCHYMATWIYDGTTTFTQMGGEGTPWIGQAPFLKTDHIFANLGDGTYFHSGSLAIRACIAAKTNITFKILYNDAVAMTGGQPVDGTLSVADMTRQLSAEGVRFIAVVSDDQMKYPVGSNFATGVTFHNRDDLPQVQKNYRMIPGVSVIVYDQTCAAEKRRRRKRGLMEDPSRRVFINENVCEGCGDCSKKSNCLSIIPKNTKFGQKRMIEQSTCNKDYSCVAGFCPSFVNVIGGVLKVQKPKAFDIESFTLPDPVLPKLSEPYNIYVSGVGGTGIVTVAALLAMAAHMEEKGCSTVDMTGLAQKGGAVVSHVRIAAHPDHLDAKRIAVGGANLLLGGDLIVASMPDALKTIKKNKTYGLINTFEAITGDFTQGCTDPFPADALKERLVEVMGKSRIDFVPATDLAYALAGDTIATNIFLLGYAYQKGWLPLSLAALEATIALNGVKVEHNLKTFKWGRVAAHDLNLVKDVAGIKTDKESAKKPLTLKEVVQERSKHLLAYQDKALVVKYQAVVEKVFHQDPKGTLAMNVAHSYAKLLAYKDEYEVARLYTDPEFMRQLDLQFESYEHLEFNLAPPLLAQINPDTGEPTKKTYGAWMMQVFKMLAGLKGLRGTPFDIFGYMKERRQERLLIQDYENLVDQVILLVEDNTYDIAAALLNLPEDIKGFGHVKEAAMAKAKITETQLLKELHKNSKS